MKEKVTNETHTSPEVTNETHNMGNLTNETPLLFVGESVARLPRARFEWQSRMRRVTLCPRYTTQSQTRKRKPECHPTNDAFNTADWVHILDGGPGVMKAYDA